MLPGFLQINGFTKGERHTVITQISDAISSSEGYIIDFKLYSNISVCFIIGLSFGNLNKFCTNLLKTDIVLYDESEKLLEQYVGGANLDDKHELMLTVQITFIHNDPDLTIETPAVPG